MTTSPQDTLPPQSIQAPKRPPEILDFRIRSKVRFAQGFVSIGQILESMGLIRAPQAFNDRFEGSV